MERWQRWLKERRDRNAIVHAACLQPAHSEGRAGACTGTELFGRGCWPAEQIKWLSQLTTSPCSMLPLLEEQMSAFARRFCGRGAATLRKTN